MRTRSASLGAATTAVLAMAAGPVSAAPDTLVYDIVAGWTVHTDRAHGFRCFMEARYEGSSLIRLGFDEAGDRMHLIVGDPVWDTLAVGEGYAVTITFGDEPPWSGNATGFNVEGEADQMALRFEVAPSGQSAFVEQLMKAYAVDVSQGGDAVTLSLAGSYQAALKLAECQEAMARVDDASRTAPEPGSPPRGNGFSARN